MNSVPFCFFCKYERPGQDEKNMTYFDAESGQVYTEVVSGRVESMVPEWTTFAKGKRDDPLVYSSRGIGCSRLQDMAMRACVWDVGQMDPEALQWLGWHYASRVYQKLVQTSVDYYSKQVVSQLTSMRSDTLTFNVWCVFRKAFPECDLQHHHFRISEGERGCEPPAQLPYIVHRLARIDASVLTFLCVRKFPFTIDDLFALTTINTLSGLVLEQVINRSHGHIDARSMRNWGRAVHESGAFKNLKLFFLCDLGPNKASVFEYTSSFPALTMLGIGHSKDRFWNDATASSGEWQKMTHLW